MLRKLGFSREKKVADLSRASTARAGSPSSKLNTSASLKPRSGGDTQRSGVRPGVCVADRPGSSTRRSTATSTRSATPATNRSRTSRRSPLGWWTSSEATGRRTCSSPRRRGGPVRRAAQGLDPQPRRAGAGAGNSVGGGKLARFCRDRPADAHRDPREGRDQSRPTSSLKDRFPLSIELRRPTSVRSRPPPADQEPEGETSLKKLFTQHRELLDPHSHLDGWSGARESVDPTTFARLYLTLPTLRLALTLIRLLARRTVAGCSAIRLVQDLLVDASKGLPRGVKSRWRSAKSGRLPRWTTFP